MGHCDKCGALAYVSVIIDTGQELTFCGHHFRENEEALAAYVTHQVDMRHLLTA